MMVVVAVGFVGGTVGVQKRKRKKKNVILIYVLL